MFNFSFYVPLRLKPQQSTVNEVKGKMYDPIFKEFAQINLIIIHLFGDLFQWLQMSDLQEWLQVLFYRFTFIAADKFDVFDQTALQIVQTVFENVFTSLLDWIYVSCISIGTLFAGSPGPDFRIPAGFVSFARFFLSQMAIITGIEWVEFVFG